MNNNNGSKNNDSADYYNNHNNNNSSRLILQWPKVPLLRKLGGGNATILEYFCRNIHILGADTG